MSDYWNLLAAGEAIDHLHHALHGGFRDAELGGNVLAGHLQDEVPSSDLETAHGKIAKVIECGLLDCGRPRIRVNVARVRDDMHFHFPGPRWPHPIITVGAADLLQADSLAATKHDAHDLVP